MENENTQITDTSTVIKKEEKEGKSLTQDEVNNLVAKIKAEEKIKREKVVSEAVDEAIKEYERKTKLTQEEREKEEIEKREKLFLEREKSLILRERNIKARELFNKNNISENLSKFVINQEEDVMIKNIEEFTKEFNEAVESAVNEKLKGEAPKDFKNNSVDRKIESAF